MRSSPLAADRRCRGGSPSLFAISVPELFFSSRSSLMSSSPSFSFRRFPIPLLLGTPRGPSKFSAWHIPPSPFSISANVTGGLHGACAACGLETGFLPIPDPSQRDRPTLSPQNGAPRGTCTDELDLGRVGWQLGAGIRASELGLGPRVP
eukprot:5278342-Pyramimonas_sp.AAC.2